MDIRPACRFAASYRSPPALAGTISPHKIESFRAKAVNNNKKKKKSWQNMHGKSEQIKIEMFDQFCSHHLREN
jgi:hypothetical protein